ncbi:MAG: hypothetical protein U1E08_08900 [Coriobacteriia bacterium]|nr:hypothetical protein [Coriobacteriia bacterium]
MNRSKSMALVTAGLVAGLVLGSVGVSYAATESETTNPVVCSGIRMGEAIRGAGARLVDVLADLTGLSTDEIVAERADGNSIADIAEANGVATETVVDSALEARKVLLDAKVADGTITQDQADVAYSQMTERVTDRVTTDETGRPAWASQGRGAGSGQGRGGMGQGGQGACGACTQTQ